MKRTVLLCVLAVSSIRFYGQRVGEIDLARHQLDKPEVRDVDVMPTGCGTASVSHGDGAIVANDPNKRPKLKVELTLPKATFKRGEIVEGSILMQNIGSEPIVIPWSLDPRVSTRPAEVSQYAYEQGWFEVKLRGPHKAEIPLESEPQSRFLLQFRVESRK